jgi:hypothetical protein
VVLGTRHDVNFADGKIKRKKTNAKSDVVAAAFSILLFFVFFCQHALHNPY